jgi:dTDP-4-dehydrorhamnose reductase
LRIAVFGRTGQVAQELARLGGDCLGRDVADFADPDAVRRAALAVEADAIVNAAAYTAVDRAETEEPLARTVNALSVAALAEAAAARGLPLVHISTDYVFDGSGTVPWRPGDATGPLGAYGRTKLEGERAVAAAGGAHAVLRTSWVFSAHGANFVKTMLRLGADRDRLRIVADQVGGPTPARGIAGACVTIAGALARDPASPAPTTTQEAPTSAGPASPARSSPRRGCAWRSRTSPPPTIPPPPRAPRIRASTAPRPRPPSASPAPTGAPPCEETLAELRQP